MAFTFTNLTFELPGNFPGLFSGWGFAFSSPSGDQLVGYDDSSPEDHNEDFDTGWNPRRGVLVTHEESAFALHDGASIAFAVDEGAVQVVIFDTGDFADILQATSIEVRDVLNTDLTGATASVVGGRVILQSDSNDGLVQALTGTAKTKIFIGDESTFILESSTPGPYALTDGDTLDVSIDGAGALTATFNTGDFADIANATAAEIAVVINTDVANANASANGNLLRIESVTARASVEMIGGTAQVFLDFPGYHDEYLGDGLDLDIADYGTAPNDTEFENFEREWAGLQAKTVTESKETYTLSDGQTLEVEVDGGATQTATFNTGDFSDIGNATAAEVAVVLNTDITGATAQAVVGLEVELISDTIGVGSSIEITGGTAAAALDFHPSPVPSLTQVKGNEVHFFGSDIVAWEALLVAASYDSGSPEDVEDFEEEWGQGSWLFTFGTVGSADGFFFEIFKTGTYVLKVEAPSYNGGVTETYTATGSTIGAVIAALEADIDANSTIATATSSSPTLVIDAGNPVSDPQIHIKLSVTSVPTGASVLIATDAGDSGIISPASYDAGTPEDFEDFEEEWPDNENFARSFTDRIEITAATNGATYAVKIESSAGSSTESYVATVGPDTISSIATSLAGELNTSIHSGVLTATPVGAFINVVQDDDDDPISIILQPTNVTDMDANRAFFDGKDTATEDQAEDFEETVDWQQRATISVATTGLYTLLINNQAHDYNAGGGDTTATIAQGLVDAVNASTVRVEAEYQSTPLFAVRLKSEHSPPAPFSLGISGPNPGDIDQDLPDTGALWAYDQFLTTIP